MERIWIAAGFSFNALRVARYSYQLAGLAEAEMRLIYVTMQLPEKSCIGRSEELPKHVKFSLKQSKGILGLLLQRDTTWLNTIAAKKRMSVAKF